MRKYQSNLILGSITFSLFARPSFLEGMARIFDFGSTLNNYNASKTTTEADTKALRGDWLTVGEDIRSAIDTWRNSKGIDVQKQTEESCPE